MKFYIRILINSFHQNFAYKFNVITQLLGLLFNLTIQITIWIALYQGQKLTVTNSGNISINEVLTYIALSTLLGALINNNVISMLDEKIKTGLIAMDLIKPFNLWTIFLSTVIGENLFKLLFQCVPVIIVVGLAVDISYPPPLYALVFIIALINAFLIYFLLCFLLGLTGFWYFTIWHLEQLLTDLVKLFAGAWIPLWFFPDYLNSLSNFLPFKYIYYVPINIYLQKLSLGNALGALLLQCLWLIILMAGSYIIWKKGIKKLVIQGG